MVTNGWTLQVVLVARHETAHHERTRSSSQTWCVGSATAYRFMSGNSNISEAVTGLKKGAIDFLLKPFHETTLVAAINKSRQRFDRSSSINRFQLTPRELLVLEHVASGLRSEQIANLLGLSVRTIKMHRSNILHKTGANTMTEAVVITRQTPTST